MPGAVSGSVNNSSYEDKDWMNRFQPRATPSWQEDLYWGFVDYSTTHTAWLTGYLHCVLSSASGLKSATSSAANKATYFATLIAQTMSQPGRKHQYFAYIYSNDGSSRILNSEACVRELKWSWHSTESRNISTEHIPSWEANISSAREGISGIYGTWRFTTDFRTARRTCTCPESD